MQGRKHAVRTKEKIDDIGKLIDLFERGTLSSAELDPTYPKEVFVDWVPPQKSTVHTTTILAKSIEGGIRNNYAFMMRPNDKRRTQNFLGKDGKTLTGVLLRACKVPTTKMHLTGTIGLDAIHPQIASYDEAATDMDGDIDKLIEEEMTSNSMLQHFATEVNGWKTSFRKTEPEKDLPDKFRRRLTAKVKHISIIKSVGEEGRRRRKWADRFAAAMKTRNHHNEMKRTKAKNLKKIWE